MSKADPSLLIDTNVWLDRYLPNRPAHMVARGFFDLCVDEGVTLLYPLRALQDVFWQVTRSNKVWVRASKGKLSESDARAINSFAWDCIDNMAEVGTPVGADASDVWFARQLRDMHPDFEDDMVLAAAERSGADYLVTSDRGLIQKATLTALTPQDMTRVLNLRKDMRS